MKGKITIKEQPLPVNFKVFFMFISHSLPYSTFTILLNATLIPEIKRTWEKHRTAYHAVNQDFNSLSQIIRDSDNVNIFKRQVFNFLMEEFINNSM